MHTLTLLVRHRWHAGLGFPVFGIANAFGNTNTAYSGVSREKRSRQLQALLLILTVVAADSNALMADGCRFERGGGGVALMSLRDNCQNVLARMECLFRLASMTHLYPQLVAYFPDFQT
jgi:hypothetical protein